MAGLLDLLSGLTGAAQPPAPNIQYNQTPLNIPPANSTDLSEVVVTPSAKKPLSSFTPPVIQQSADQTPTPVAMNYDNSAQVAALRQAVQNDYAPPGGYNSKDSGLYGLLPQGLQHGTLRSILGHLGDAFLVGTGHQAIYQPRADRLAEGNAMAGYDQNPEAAIQRLAATGAPDAMKDADQLQTNKNATDRN